MRLCRGPRGSCVLYGIPEDRSLRILALETSGTSGTVAALDGERLLVEKALDPALHTPQPGSHDSPGPQGGAVAATRSASRGRRDRTRLVHWAALGVMTAKAFAFAVAAQVQGIGTLEVIAARAGNRPGDCRGHRVQRSELYVARFRRAAGEGV